jgi:hypothetical protein
MLDHSVSEVRSAAQGQSMNSEPSRRWIPPAELDRHLSMAMRWSLLAGLVFLVGLFYVFTYNSGYGYDALEYLVIGRAISNGSAFYSLIPSKSPGIYYLIAALFSLGLPRNHAVISAGITLFFAASLVSTWLVAQHFFGYPVAVVATLLVAACAIFMEMNFLEPESLVFLCGLAAFPLVLRSLRTKTLTPLFVAGISLAVGFQFKSVAAFYCLGIVGFLVFRLLRLHSGLVELLRQGAALSVGFLFGCSVPFLFFAAAGKAADFWLWTIKFPLFYYPANTYWLDKLFTKLLWFHLLLLISMVCSLFIRARRTVWKDDAAALAFFMGLASYLALLKTQASHYCFPGAAFFSIFIAATLLTTPKSEGRAMANRRRFMIAAAFATLLVITVSAVSYRPQAVSRFLEWRSFDNEQVIGEAIRRELNPGEKALFVKDGTFLYWASDVEPATRFIHFDIQTTYYVERNPDALLNALKDPSTVLVEFNPEDPGFEDPRFIELTNRSLVEFTRVLKTDFRPAGVNAPPFQFWTRKNVSDRRLVEAVLYERSGNGDDARSSL